MLDVNTHDKTAMQYKLEYIIYAFKITINH